MKRFYGSDGELTEIWERLKLTPCPHCKEVGALIRHGAIAGHDEANERRIIIRARRIFCSNRKCAKGCGRTFSVWADSQIRRLQLTAGELWTFLKQASTTGNKLEALRSLGRDLDVSTAYRVWKRFREAQSAIRTALGEICSAPAVASADAETQTLAHLEAAFPGDRCPIRAYQRQWNTFFV